MTNSLKLLYYIYVNINEVILKIRRAYISKKLFGFTFGEGVGGKGALSF